MLLLIPFWAALALRLPQQSLAAPTLDERSSGRTLADGSYFQSGSISSNLMWQSSGVLTQGGCSVETGIASTTAPAASSQKRDGRAMSAEDLAAEDDDDLDAYDIAFPDESDWGYGDLMEKRQLVLRNCSSSGGGGSGGGTPKPPSPRQRIELFTWPGARAGESWQYEWKSRTSDTSTSSKFFHIWQILRRDACGGPVVTLDLKGGQAAISDTRRGCSNCASVSVSEWMGRTISHTLTITFGLEGSLSYSASAAGPLGSNVLSTPLLTYEAKGDMGDKASLKFGSYRAVVEGMEAVTSWVGDLQAKQLS
ncbi:hypothetical protein JCM11641_004934 [Rhodosporidiobolus odoratus]